MGRGKRGHFMLLRLHKFGRFDWTFFVGSCIQRALVSCDQRTDALCTIVSILTDNLIGCKFEGCNQQHCHEYIRPILSQSLLLRFPLD